MVKEVEFHESRFNQALNLLTGDVNVAELASMETQYVPRFFRGPIKGLVQAANTVALPIFPNYITTTDLIIRDIPTITKKRAFSRDILMFGIAGGVGILAALISGANPLIGGIAFSTVKLAETGMLGRQHHAAIKNARRG